MTTLTVLVHTYVLFKDKFVKHGLLHRMEDVFVILICIIKLHSINAASVYSSISNK
jgi:hypothetical protein